MEGLCRLCAAPQSELVAVLEDVDTCSKILHLLQININSEDRLPVVVCNGCRENVLNMWEFHQQVQRAQQLLQKRLAEQEILESKSYSSTQPLKQDFDPQPSQDISSLVNIPIPPPDPIPGSESNIVPNPVQNSIPNLDSTSVPNPVSNSITNSVSSNPTLSNTVTRIRVSKIKNRKSLSKKKDSRRDFLCVDILGISKAEWHEDGSVTFPKGAIDGWDAYPWNCMECNDQLGDASELKQHFISFHGRPVHYRCVDCPKIYTKLVAFAAHVRAHRPSLRFCCETCLKWFGTTVSLEQHRNSSHCDSKPFNCNTCGKRFRVQSSLAQHLRSHLPAELKNRHQCDQCPKKFGTRPNLLAHRRIHAGVREFTCDQCGKSFVQKGNLDNHMLTHSAARPFSCTVCDKTFKTAVRLRKHSFVHSGIKPFQCEECGRQFRERGTLREHIRIHTGAMPFTCEFCGKAFRFKGVLTTHRRQHTGERPYSCLECQHHFTNWPNYNKHMKRRHGINTSVSVRKPQSIPPTGMPQRNPPGTVLAPPQLNTVEPAQTNFAEVASAQQFYPTAVLNLYNIPEELLQQRV